MTIAATLDIPTSAQAAVLAELKVSGPCWAHSGPTRWRRVNANSAARCYRLGWVDRLRDGGRYFYRITDAGRAALQRAKVCGR